MSERSGHLLIVDDDPDIRTAGQLLLKRHLAKITTTGDPCQLPQLLAEHDFDAILLDMNFSPGESDGAQGFYWLKKILSQDPQAVVIMITAHSGVNIAVEAMKLGATDFIAKPWQNEKVVATLSAALKLRASQKQTQTLRQANQLLSDTNRTSALLGASPAMQQVMGLVARAAPTDANVLILGENGTGKELVARQLHAQSLRKDQVFMAIDLGAVAETLFESELFGHRKGAFTGAQEDRLGKLLAANGGTLFLDEVGNLPLHLQAKLLTVLEQRRVTPLGANQSQPFDVRVIAATNLPPAQLRDETRFRQDLLFRLNTVELQLPPLRERGQDIALIARHYARVYAQKYHQAPREFSPQALAAITHYRWPGNVRALRHAIERAVILSQTPEFEVADFPLDMPPEQTYAGASASRELPEDLNLVRQEQRIIQTALKKHGYNISHAAKELGLTRAALYRRMEKHGL
ncbi:sigma-54 dependent transcriptional regulator [Simiduia sp. 21SJ11W-1]|uniref:sigma-54-dependent transcriptional regulator n=1 Tax=Simiduia sp. 21SJ11W-1 TaxID=2909669 RepID=UPI00209D85ED|nr:sigma-54 dependent transcriptional regulator [Simiduia sp. 21SJ11W-1]UTA48447.1 sigma-54 dependent transcriptional regulator [Simiduia sp. 21SJ11W-1]